MQLDNAETRNGLQLVPETHGMNVPSTCTIVFISGKWILISLTNIQATTPSLGKYIDKVDRVMTQVDRITEDIDHMPLAAFIIRDKESDDVQYSNDIRWPSQK